MIILAVFGGVVLALGIGAGAWWLWRLGQRVESLRESSDASIRDIDALVAAHKSMNERVVAL